LLQERLRREEQTARRIREQKEHEVKKLEKRFKFYI
jgi:hypothetical protein